MGIETLFNHMFTIERKMRTSDGHGNFPESRTLIGTALGRIRPASAREKEVAAVTGREISHVLYVLTGTVIGRGDLVSTGDLVVEALGVREPSEAGHHLEVDCLEVQAEAWTEVGS